jgi:hypothetical protein
MAEKRFEVSLIDFKRGFFKKVETNDDTSLYIINLKEGTISPCSTFDAGGTVTITGDLSIITAPREKLIEKACEDYLKQIERINALYRGE